jgi:hypothetical protein
LGGPDFGTGIGMFPWRLIKQNCQKKIFFKARDAPDSVFAGYPAGRISG